MKYLVVIFLIFNNLSSQNKKIRVDRGNIDYLNLSYYANAISDDSLRILACIEIPYFSLQFVKIKNNFIASFESSIIFTDIDGVQIGKKSVLDSIKVDNYVETLSNTKIVKYYFSKNIILSKLSIIGELIDGDTRKRSMKSVDLDFDRKKPFILEPIILIKSEGDYGYGFGLIPIPNNKIKDIKKGLYFYASGFIKKKEYKVNFYLKDDDNLILIDSIQAQDNTSKFFKHLFYIPSDKLQVMRVESKIELLQGKKKRQKLKIITTYRPGLSTNVNDILESLDQMKYILSNEEKKLIKGKKKKELEILFLNFWEKRNPSSESETNELMEEYYSRVQFSNEYFNMSWKKGWESDMGMIYILFGPPDEIQKTNSNSTSNSIYQVWHYYKINKQFVFKDQNNFGDFRLEVPFQGPLF
tara:strand:+ start:594 stop:1832 length:1239 start_codon:yes stop_codon:yes gene_type:complete